jgi:DNA-binding NarL/FixJ family response regulator
MSEIRVAIFEDNKHLRESLFYLVNGTTGFTCTGAFHDCTDLLFKLKQCEPDVILMDIEMPGISGIDAVKIVKMENPSIQILMQTIFHDDENIFNSICAGASGYILKTTSPAGYIEAIQDVYNGGSPMSSSIARRVLTLFQKNITPAANNNYALTPKEKDILQQMVQGKSFKMIAAATGITYETVRTHMKNIYLKLHVNSNTEAVSKALREKIVS